MSWVRLDDGFYRHPKARKAGLKGRSLYMAALCHCAANLTDGFVSDEALPLLLAEAEVPRATLRAVTDAGLWVRVEGGYRIPDFLDFNPPRTKVLEERERARKRMAKRRGGSGEVRANTTPNDEGTSGAVRMAPPHPTPSTYSDPSPSSDVGGGDGDGGLLEAACRVLAEREADARDGQLYNRSGWVRSRVAKLTREHDGEAARLAADHPGLTAEQLARYLSGERPRLSVVRPACATCNGSRWLDPDETDVVHPCPDCSAAAGGAR